MSAPSGNASERGGGADGAGAPDAARLPPEQQQGLQSLKAALQDVSKKPGATVGADRARCWRVCSMQGSSGDTRAAAAPPLPPPTYTSLPPPA